MGSSAYLILFSGLYNLHPCNYILDQIISDAIPGGKPEYRWLQSIPSFSQPSNSLDGIAPYEKDATLIPIYLCGNGGTRKLNKIHPKSQRLWGEENAPSRVLSKLRSYHYVLWHFILPQEGQTALSCSGHVSVITQHGFSFSNTKMRIEFPSHRNNA